MIDEQDIIELLIESIEQQIDSLEDTDQDKAVYGELKLLLSDNVTDDGKIHIRSSLMKSGRLSNLRVLVMVDLFLPSFFAASSWV